MPHLKDCTGYWWVASDTIYNIIYNYCAQLKLQRKKERKKETNKGLIEISTSLNIIRLLKELHSVYYLKQNHPESIKKKEIKKNEARQYFLEKKITLFYAPRVPRCSLR